MRNIFSPLVLGAFLFVSSWSCQNAESTSKAPEVDFKRTSNEVIMAIRAEPEGLNPITATTSHARQINEMMFQYLLNIHPQELTLQPELATSRPQAEDLTEGPFAGGVAYRFEIRKEAVWDDGRPVTAHDFLFTIKACLHPNVQAPRVVPFISVIKEVQIDPDNPKRFTVYTAEKDILGEESIAWSVPVLPAHIYDPQGALTNIPYPDFLDAKKIERLVAANAALRDFAEAFNGVKYTREIGSISGSGPYELVAWDAGQRLMLRRKDNWWGEGIEFLQANPDTVTFVFIASAESALATIRAEEVDVLRDVSPEDFVDLRETEFAAERYQFLTPPQLAHYFLYLNTNQPQLQDKRVRRALAHLVDVDDILETYFLGYGRRHASPVFLESNYYNQSLTPIPYDVERAQQLLTEAGWVDTDGNGVREKVVKGEKVELKIPYLYSARSEVQENIGLLVKESAIKAGVEIELISEEYSILNNRTKTGDYHIALNGKSISPTYWSPKQEWHTSATGGGDNRTGFGNAETDALIDEIMVTLDEAKRNDLYRRLQQIIYDEQPVIFLFIPQGRLIVHKRFDIEETPIAPGFVAKDLKLNLIQ